MRIDGRAMYHLEMRVLVSLLCLIPLFAQPPQDAPKKGSGGQRPPAKNLKVLKVQPSELIPLMQTYRVALGNVRCDYCHVAAQPPDFASDENPKKEIARHMIAMVQDINAKVPDVKEKVTCYTCHHGDALPKSAPPPAAPAGQ